MRFITKVKALMLVIAMLIMAPANLFAVEPSEMLNDPVLEARARELSKGLRCVVCRNQSIDDSNAALAKDLRVLLRERISAGESDEQAVQYLVDRYGPYILLKPPLRSETYLLWGAPLLLLLAAIAGFSHVWRRRKNEIAPDELSSKERALAQSILKSEVTQ